MNRTIGLRELKAARHLRIVVDNEGRPRTRGECVDGPRPCPWVSCRHHLYAEITLDGGLRVVWPDLEPGDMHESCSLDVADRGGVRDAKVGALLNVTRARARQIEDAALQHLRGRLKARGIRADAIAPSPEPSGHVVEVNRAERMR